MGAMSSQMTYRILLIDDDREMNDLLSRRLAGHRVDLGDTQVSFLVESVEVRVVPERPGYWRFADETIDCLKAVSSRRYDLIMADYGLVDDEAKDILWGKDRQRTPTRDEAKGRVLTLRDLSRQYAASVAPHSPNIFLAARDVYLRSFVSRLAFDLLGPVHPDRTTETQAAFPNAHVMPFDPRNELYGGDAFYSFYDQPGGRDFYRQLVAHHVISVVEGYILRGRLPDRRRLRLRRSVFNIALFAGSVALVGWAAQYLASVGASLFLNGNRDGWWWILAGLFVLAGGALLLSLYFEAFSRSVIRWVGPEDAFEDRQR